MASGEAPRPDQHVETTGWIGNPCSVQVRLDDEFHEVRHDVRRPGQLGDSVLSVTDEVLFDVAVTLDTRRSARLVLGVLASPDVAEGPGPKSGLSGHAGN